MERTFQVGVKAFITDKRGRLLVLKKTPIINDSWALHWDLPGGRITKEGINGTLRRELVEEIGVSKVNITGLRSAGISNLKITTKRGKFWLMLLVFNCKIPANARIRLNHEHSEYKWVTIREAKKLLAYKFPKEIVGSL